jgi:hypothetical protein
MSCFGVLDHLRLPGNTLFQQIVRAKVHHKPRTGCAESRLIISWNSFNRSCSGY